MAAAFRIRDKIFRCLVASNHWGHLPLCHKRLSSGLKAQSFRHFTETKSITPPEHDKHTHRPHRRPHTSQVPRGKTSVKGSKNPTMVINQCFTYVNNYNGRENLSFDIKPRKDDIFSCELKIMWPKEMIFVGTARDKKGAMRDASEKAILALIKAKKITADGLPVLVKTSKPVGNPEIALTPDDQQMIFDLQDHYEQVKFDIELAKTVKLTEFGAIETEDDDPTDIIYNVRRSHVSVASSKRRYIRSLNLKERLRRPKIRLPLPIDDYKDELLAAVEKYRVVLLRAETGSGKSSRFPQFIFDHFAAQGRGADCNIVVTQPRRLTTISLARHVAKERNEDLGDVVGYSVRLDHCLPRPPGGSILYCTAGKLLQSLVLNPDLEGVSHICLDEVHERPYDIDLIMGLLRRVLQRNRNLHVTLMSATMDAEEFKTYFGGDCFVLDAPGRSYPVETHFLEDLPKDVLKKNGEKTEYPMLARIVRWLDKGPPGGILMFLPGWKEIQGVNNLLECDERFFVVVLHSNVPLIDQLRVHQAPPEGQRKVVLATNIAESSITIADIIHVVDFPYERVGRFSFDSNEVEHTLVPCPKSRLLQRRGRAGRCQPGHCYHLVSEEEYNQLPEATVPILHNMSLDYPILLSKALVRGESAQSFFSQLVSPPADDHIIMGIKSLKDLGALDSEETLTPLGKRLLHFGLEPRPAKAMVLSAILRCQNIVSVFLATSEFFPFNIFSNFPNTLKSTDVHPSSDHMVLVNLFHLWLELEDQRPAWHRLAESSGLSISYGEVAMANKLAKNLLERLYSSKMLRAQSPNPLESGQLQKEELLKGILLNVHPSLGLVKKAERGPVPSDKVRVSTSSGRLLRFSKESVCKKKNIDFFSTPFFFYHPSVDTGNYVTSRCTSLMSPVSVLLFMPGPFKVVVPEKLQDDSDRRIVGFDESIKIELNRSDCESLVILREMMEACTNYFIHKEGTSEIHTTGYSKIDEFRQHLIEVLEHILNTYAPSKSETHTESASLKKPQFQVVDIFKEET